MRVWNRCVSWQTSLKLSKAERIISWPPLTKHIAANSSKTKAFVRRLLWIRLNDMQFIASLCRITMLKPYWKVKRTIKLKKHPSEKYKPIKTRSKIQNEYFQNLLTLLFIIALMHIMHTWISSLDSPMFNLATCFDLLLMLGLSGMSKGDLEYPLGFSPALFPFPFTAGFSLSSESVLDSAILCSCLIIPSLKLR